MVIGLESLFSTKGTERSEEGVDGVYREECSWRLPVGRLLLGGTNLFFKVKAHWILKSITYCTVETFTIFVGRCNSIGVLPVLITTSPGFKNPRSFKIFI